MKDVKRTDNYVSYIVEDHKEYLAFIKLVLNNTDVVCFKVSPFLDSLEEFRHSIWSYLNDNVLYTTCDVEISDASGNISHLLFLKNDYTLYEFFLNKKNLFDFEETDRILGITLENPVFIRGGEAICFSITHEESCTLDKDLYLKLVKIGRASCRERV